MRLITRHHSAAGGGMIHMNRDRRGWRDEMGGYAWKTESRGLAGSLCEGNGEELKDRS